MVAEMTASVDTIQSGRYFRVKRILAGKTFKDGDERDATIAALYKFSDQDFSILWNWYRRGGEV